MTRWPGFGRSLAPLALVLLSASAVSAQSLGGFVYALQQVPGDNNRLHGFRQDPGAPRLFPLPGFPLDTGGLGTSNLTTELLAQGGGRLYAINDLTDTLSVYAIDRSNGSLTPVPFHPIALGTGTWVCVAVHPSGSPVVVGDADGRLASFVTGDTTATAAPGSPFSTDQSRPYSCAFSRDGNYVYTGGNTGIFVAGFSVAVATGVLTTLPGSPFDFGGPSPVGYSLDSDGRLFTVLADAPEVRAFTTVNGVPTGVAGNPFASRLAVGVHGLLHPAGFYITADRAANRVGVYRISFSGADTRLTAVTHSPAPSGGTLTTALALSDDGMWLHAANGNTRNISGFAFSSGTGSLELVLTQPVNSLGTVGATAGLVFVARLRGAGGRFDFDGDRSADLGIFRPSTRVWWIAKSSASFFQFATFSFGFADDTPVPGDYDGDGKMDIAVFRTPEGIWHMLLSTTNYTTYRAQAWGQSGDIPVPGDYDGDSTDDIAVYRPSTGEWWILQSSSGNTTHSVHVWGASTDLVAPADYDGDSRMDIAVYRPSAGVWWILQSRTNFLSSAVHVFGTAGDVPVPGDYDGDGRSDVAVFRPSTGLWSWLRSGTGFTTSRSVVWGLATDIAVPADYDRDGKPEVAVFRPSTGVWFRRDSRNDYGSGQSYQWGMSGDIPLPKR